MVDALRAEGCAVLSLAALGRGVPDLLVVLPWRETVLVEVKNGERSGAELTDDQERWFRAWPGRIVVVWSVEEARRLAREKTLTSAANPPILTMT